MVHKEWKNSKQGFLRENEECHQLGDKNEIRDNKKVNIESNANNTNADKSKDKEEEKDEEKCYKKNKYITNNCLNREQALNKNVDRNEEENLF